MTPRAAFPPRALPVPVRPAFLAATLLTLACVAPASAQVDHRHADHSPYAGTMEERAIKALASEEVEGLLAGEGLGFALAAELNGLPGPRHVLDLAEELELDPRQRSAVEAVHARMDEAARDLGRRLVEEERHLDHLFAQGHATSEAVRNRTASIAGLRGELRAVHLVAHLETAEVLSHEQVATYTRLRGYAPDPG